VNHSLFQSERSRKAWTLIKVVGIVLLGIILGVIAAASTATVYKRSLLDRARTAAQAVEVAQIKQLTGSEADLTSASYKNIKQELSGLHQVNRDSRFVYIMGQRDNAVFFYADSEPADSNDYSPPGQTFDEASAELSGMFSTGEDVIEGPIRDRWGIWLSALTAIRDPQTGQVVGVLGIDVPAKEYLGLVGAVAAFPISIAVTAAVVIGVVDVTRRRRQERVEMQAELVSAITHELNNPLTGIRWGSELLLSTYRLEGPGGRVVGSIHDSVCRLQESVDDVLEIARLGRGSQQLNVQTVDVTALMHEIFQTQGMPADHKQVQLAFGPGWPGQLLLPCDSSKMKRVFNNLLSNAIKYTRNETSVVVDYERRGPMHRISIKDQGIGIPKEEQAKVFGGFYRASNAVKSGVHGTGMGLFLVKKTIEQHGGAIEVVSEEGKGTTVMVDMPNEVRVTAP
jgi:signal transduction histidine kinase